jgi:hypothetical protein
VSRADLDKNPHDVARMFDGVARRYDLTNTVLTAGQDRRWRSLTREALALQPGERVLDLAAGTAVSTVELGRSGAWCVAADFSIGMLRAGERRLVPKVAADALHLPFGDAVFDAVTISFGLRNVADPAVALAALARVTRSCPPSRSGCRATPRPTPTSVSRSGTGPRSPSSRGASARRAGAAWRGATSRAARWPSTGRPAPDRRPSPPGRVGHRTGPRSSGAGHILPGQAHPERGP